MAATQREPASAPRVRFTITTWGTALRNVRITADISYREIAAHLNVSRGLVRVWEDGEGYPTGYQMSGLYKMKGMQSLRAYAYLLPQTEQKFELGDAPPSVLPPIALPDAETQEIDQPRDFPNALRLARRASGLHQHEVADLMKVIQSTISSWELGGSTPIQAHYDLLVELFPELRDVEPPPGIRAMSKPGFPAGSVSFPDRAPAERSAPIASSSSPSADSPPRALVPRPQVVRPDVVVAVDPVAMTIAAVLEPPTSIAVADEAGRAYARALVYLTAREAELATATARVDALTKDLAAARDVADRAFAELQRIAKTGL